MTFVAGQILRASQLRAIIPTKVPILSDQSVTNSATLVDATNITISGALGTTVEVALDLMYQGTVAGDFKCAWAWTTGTFPWGFLGVDTGLAVSDISFDVTVTSGTTFNLGANGANNTMLTRIRGIWTVGASTGTLKFQFAQAVAGGATSATIKTGTLLTSIVIT